MIGNIQFIQTITTGQQLGAFQTLSSCSKVVIGKPLNAADEAAALQEGMAMIDVSSPLASRLPISEMTRFTSSPLPSPSVMPDVTYLSTSMRAAALHI